MSLSALRTLVHAHRMCQHKLRLSATSIALSISLLTFPCTFPQFLTLKSVTNARRAYAIMYHDLSQIGLATTSNIGALNGFNYEHLLLQQQLQQHNVNKIVQRPSSTTNTLPHAQSVSRKVRSLRDSRHFVAALTTLHCAMLLPLYARTSINLTAGACVSHCRPWRFC